MKRFEVSVKSRNSDSRATMESRVSIEDRGLQTSPQYCLEVVLQWNGVKFQ